MNKFKFRLEPVLKHREIREEQAAKEHARALAEFRRNNDNLCAARERYAMAMQTYKPASPFDYINQVAYCESMSKEINKLEVLLSKSLKKSEKCLQNLVKAMQDRSVMEKLKEKQFRSYELVSNMLEQKEIDNIATRLFICNQR